MPFGAVARSALLLRDTLETLGLASFAMTTGGDGLHVRVPIARRHAYAEVRRFARVVAGALRRSAPELVTTEASPERRRGVHVDVKMNGHGQQLVAPYSVRPRPGAPVAAPLTWDEVDEKLDPAAFTLVRVAERVAERGDLLAGALAGRQRLGPALARAA